MPADHGPIAVYWMPRQAMAAWSASVSNDSATKSATAIGRTRVIVLPSCRPRPRNVRPSLSPAIASPRPGDSMSGGVWPGDVAEEAGQRADEPVERRVPLGVGRRSRPQALGGPGGVAPQRDGVAVRARREDAHVRADERQAVAP